MKDWVRKGVFLVSLLVARTAASGASQDTVRLATLEWPPYNSLSLPDGGVNTAVIRQAFELAGYRLEIVSMPWMRSVQRGLHDPSFDGYFPEYLSPSVQRNCYVSAATGESPVVLAERKQSHLGVTAVSQLSRYLVGVVNGYNNTVEFDNAVASGKQPVDRANSDEENLEKLSKGRVDLIIIDENVMHWTLTHSPALMPFASSIEALQPPLIKQNLYVCFKRTRKGRKLAADFNEGLRHVDVPSFVHGYLMALPGR